ncbi:hypothetical protein PENANT_c023G10556 [Penicillium antarcticum]|uniref:Rhodopsin domain-containing protein n=1 Tax=Penicillium antarcticum TaxID=416450 RepID=A0A1V6PZ62_9EURO|nr:hypothetical protein PENANT_c023G10556 [Penicillium antarcticum]
MSVKYDVSQSSIQGPLIAAAVFGDLATLSTVLRLYAMHLRGLRPGLSEYLLLVGVFLMYGAMSLLYIMTIYGGMGRHTADLPPEALIITLKSLLSVEITYGTSLGLVKTSIALFFVRIFGAKPSFNVAVSISLFIDITIKDTCGNRPAAFMVAGVMNVVTDFMVISLPLPHVWKLKLNVHKKIGLTSVFGVGVVISVISVVRLISITKLDFTDPTYTLLDPILWTVL